jgi:hypothetical protein
MTLPSTNQVRSGQSVDPDGWADRMRRHGVLPNVVTYTTLCQPAASRGDFVLVERLMSYIAEENLPVNHYCLAVLLNVRFTFLLAKSLMNSNYRYDSSRAKSCVIMQ